MTNKLPLWKGEFGDSYHERNTVTDDQLKAKGVLWANIIPFLLSPLSVPESYLEVGAGLGANLITINNIYNANGRQPNLYALEPNKKAQRAIKALTSAKLVDGDALNIQTSDSSFDVVFTNGVLIHLHPDDTLKAMKEIYRVSKKWIVCIEYFSPELREHTYHGEKALWTQDFGELWLNNFKLRCATYAFYWKRMTGLDNVTGWVFEKVN